MVVAVQHEVVGHRERRHHAVLAAVLGHVAHAELGDVARRPAGDVLAGDPSAPLYTLGAAAVVFAAMFLLFRRGLVGGGDVKLLTAAALLIGYRDLLGFLFLMSLCGAVISLAILVVDKLVPLLRRSPRPGMLAVAEKSWRTPERLNVPYGVAIATAGIVILALQSSIAG